VALRRLELGAERQEFIKVKGRDYALDFAIFCHQGKLAIETDGDTWHADPARREHDYVRDNDLEADGWRLLRFNTRQITEQLADYCLPAIVEQVNALGGPDEGRVIPRRAALTPDSPRQLSLFDDRPGSS
jgi:very-short-patch-repair endonuclease